MIFVAFPSAAFANASKLFNRMTVSSASAFLIDLIPSASAAFTNLIPSAYAFFVARIASA